MELLLARQYPSISPAFLVLSDLASGPRLTRSAMFRLAQQSLQFLRLWLCGLQLQRCERLLISASPCWSQLAHGKCTTKTCVRAHSWGLAQGDAFVAAVRHTLRCRDIGKRHVGDAEAMAACRSLGATGLADVQSWLGRCERLLLRLSLPGPQSMAWLSRSLQATAAADEVRFALLQWKIDQFLQGIHKVHSGKLALEDVLKPPLVLCPLVGFHGLPGLRLRAKDGAWPLVRKMVSMMETLQAENQLRLNEGMRKPTHGDLLNFFEMTCEVVQHVHGQWKSKSAGSIGSFPYSPQVVCHLLEQGVVWANVLLTRMSNTTLPQSYVRIHLSQYPHLAGLAAAHDLPEPRRKKCQFALKVFASTAVGCLKNPEKFREWLKAKSPETSQCNVCLRLLTVIFSCGTINWLRNTRNDICSLIQGINFEGKLQLLNGGEVFMSATR